MAKHTYEEVVAELNDFFNKFNLNIDLSSISEILIKKLAASNTLNHGSSTNQTHIALTGKERWMFPYLVNPAFDESGDNRFKRRDQPHLDVELLKRNIDYLKGNSSRDDGIVNTFTTTCLGKRRSQGDQTELSDISRDDPEFINFRRLLYEGDFLVILRRISGEYIFLGFKADDAEILTDYNGFYASERTGTPEEYRILHNLENELIENSEIFSEFEEYRQKGQIEFITFHPSVAYEQFIEGICFDVENNGRYIYKDGIFKQICIKALYLGIKDKIKDSKYDITKDTDYKKIKTVVKKYLENGKNDIDWSSVVSDPSKRMVLIIDEINRGDISKIFGEIITLLEADKRIGGSFELKLKLPYSNEIFGIPPNLFIMGTMNTADRSIALIDIALRRRFGFFEMCPEFGDESELIRQHKEKGTYDLIKKSVDALEIINSRISESELSREKTIGHSFLFHIRNENELKMVWHNELLPLLEEYCYGDFGLIKQIMFGNTADGSEFITETKGIIDDADYKELVKKIINSKPST